MRMKATATLALAASLIAGVTLAATGSKGQPAGETPATQARLATKAGLVAVAQAGDSLVAVGDVALAVRRWSAAQRLERRVGGGVAEPGEVLEDAAFEAWCAATAVVILHSHHKPRPDCLGHAPHPCGVEDVPVVELTGRRRCEARHELSRRQPERDASPQPRIFEALQE